MHIKRELTFLLIVCSVASRAAAEDVYGSAVTARSLALNGIYLDSPGPTDALASNPAALTWLDRPYLELTGVGILAGGQFHNTTPYVGGLDSNAGVSASAGFGMQVPHTRLSLGFGAFPISLLSDRWKYQDPPGTAGASYGVQSNKSAFLAIQSSLGISYRVTQHLSLGAAFGIVDNLNTLETPYVFQSNPALAGLKTLLDLHTSGIGYNGTFGLIAEPTRRLKLGVAYKTRTTVRSTGTASGDAYAQFAALGLPYASSFRYRAEVDNTFPQSASVSVGWQAQQRLRTYLQGDWLDWRNAFTQLPVHLTNGNNTLIDTILNSTSLNDSVPLHWRNQASIKAGFEFALGESFALEGAYGQANRAVPASTLTPLTAALMTKTVSAGIEHEINRFRLQLGYQLNPPDTARVGTSALLAGEYSDTRTSLWLQTVALTVGTRF